MSHLGLGRWGRGEKPLDIWKGEASLAGRKGGAQTSEVRRRAGGRGAWEGAARSLLFYENPAPGLGPERLPAVLVFLWVWGGAWRDEVMRAMAAACLGSCPAPPHLPTPQAFPSLF